MSLINYSGIDNFDLYNNNGSNTSNYSSLDSAFNHKLPGDINNNYSDHNSISNTDRDNYKDEMSEYNNFTNTIKNMKISDFNLSESLLSSFSKGFTSSKGSTCLDRLERGSSFWSNMDGIDWSDCVCDVTDTSVAIKVQ